MFYFQADLEVLEHECYEVNNTTERWKWPLIFKMKLLSQSLKDQKHSSSGM